MGHTVAEGPYQVATRVCSVLRHVQGSSRSHPHQILFGALVRLFRQTIIGDISRLFDRRGVADSQIEGEQMRGSLGSDKGIGTIGAKFDRVYICSPPFAPHICAS